MKKVALNTSLILFFLMVLKAAVAQSPQNFSVASRPEDLGFSSERLARIDTFLSGMVARNQATSIATFVARKGQIVHQKVYGYSHLETKTPARPDDIYRMMSQTKLVTTVGLLMLMEEGRFYLDQPIADFLPAFAHPTVLESYDEKDHSRYKTRPANKAITFRHILSHTAGIPYISPLSDLPEFKIPFLASTDNIKLETLVNQIATIPLEADPGEKYVYGLSTDIAGRLIEVLSGQTLDEFLRARVCAPLGMTDTYFYLPSDKAKRLVGLYSLDKKGDKFRPHDNKEFIDYPILGAKSLFWGGSGMSGTISDYARLCQMIANLGEFNGQRLLSPSTVRTMMVNQIGNLPLWDSNDKFGLGLQIFTPESRSRDIATPGTVQWGGYFATDYSIDVEKDLVVLVYTNVQPYAYGSELQHIFRTMVYSAFMD
jgi:CubicO group peptidase (beta-lactamase class C family)